MKSKKSTVIKKILLSALFLVVASGLILSFYTLLLPKKYETVIEHIAREYGVDGNLVFAMVRAESNFKEDAVSSAGARGLMQLMPSTALFIENNIGNSLDICDAEDNIRMGVWYVAYLGKKFDTLDEVLAAYNAGEGTVRKWLNDERFTDGNGSLTEIPYSETRNYVKRVKNFYKYYNFFYF